MHDNSETEPGPWVPDPDVPTDPGSSDPDPTDPTGITLAEPITDDQLAELDFLRYESAHLQARVRELEKQLRDTERERDTIQHERNLMAQDFQWTLKRLSDSPLAPVLKRMPGFRALDAKWGSGNR